MNIGIVGGRLQGLEACYLAKKAGWHVTLIDKDERCISAGLADRFYCADVLTGEKDGLLEVLSKCDLLLPAVENNDVLERLAELSRECGLSLVYDEKAYRISSSKILSNRLFQELGLKIPAAYPDGDFPYIVKPSGCSGSFGVRLARNGKQLKEFAAGYEGEIVVQEYIPGPSYSIEVVGNGCCCTPYLVTEIVTDDNYDCCEVTAAADLCPAVDDRMSKIGETIGTALKIKGIFDVETILGTDGNLYVLEIDARFPSQTPITVYHACGINLLKMLCGQENMDRASLRETTKNVLYLNIHAEKAADLNGNISVSVTNPGEHALAAAGKMRIVPGFLGTEEAITDYREGASEFFAILVFSGESMDDVRSRCRASQERLRESSRW